MGGVHRRVGVGGVGLHWVGVRGFRVHEAWWVVLGGFRARWITHGGLFGVRKSLLASLGM